MSAIGFLFKCQATVFLLAAFYTLCGWVQEKALSEGHTGLNPKQQNQISKKKKDISVHLGREVLQSCTPSHLWVRSWAIFLLGPQLPISWLTGTSLTVASMGQNEGWGGTGAFTTGAYPGQTLSWNLHMEVETFSLVRYFWGPHWALWVCQKIPCVSDG